MLPCVVHVYNTNFIEKKKKKKYGNYSEVCFGCGVVVMDMCITPIAHSNRLIATMTHSGQLCYILIRCTQGSQPNFLNINYLVSQLQNYNIR